ncbi:hypothetical protein [Vibrio jasicida]|uniref:hypothetical protein n=1 Tax=Vibrio jasicida TaxID=766224 RepID=UPI0005F07B88|nr:hypothetical protein [Vibrio jasicida]
MSLLTINNHRYVSKFIKRLEKKGFITKPISKANYRKVRIMASHDERCRRIIFITHNGLEMYVDIDLFSLAIDPASYLNKSYHDVKSALEVYRDKIKEHSHAEHSNTGASDSTD